MQAENFTSLFVSKEGSSQKELKDFLGKKIVLYFYPKDLTPGCSLQAENLSENFSSLLEKNVAVIGVSKDGEKSHQKFIEKKDIPFYLVCDENCEVSKLYGVWKTKKFMGKEFLGIVRTTFLIDENFKIVKIIDKPNVKNHTQEILEGFGLNGN